MYSMIENREDVKLKVAYLWFIFFNIIVDLMNLHQEISTQVRANQDFNALARNNQHTYNQILKILWIVIFFKQ